MTALIAQALQAETFKLFRNRWATFWAYGFMPVFALVAGIVEETLVRAYAGDPLAYANPVMEGFAGLGTLQSSLFQVFAISGAAMLFAGEYRWETWRSILPRNERGAVLLAKLALYAAAITVSILASGVARFLVGLIDMALTGDAVWPASPWPGLLVGFGSAFLQLMVTGALVMLVSVVTRSTMAAIIAPLVLLVGLDIATVRIRLPDADLWAVALPNVASSSVRQLGVSMLGDADAYGTHLAGPAVVAMIGWVAILAAAALLIFRQQDLSRE